MLSAGIGCAGPAQPIWKEGPGTLSVTVGLDTTYYTGDLAVIGNYNHLALGAALNLGLMYR